jgi:hypothetical protein
MTDTNFKERANELINEISSIFLAKSEKFLDFSKKAMINAFNGELDKISIKTVILEGTLEI